MKSLTVTQLSKNIFLYGSNLTASSGVKTVLLCVLLIEEFML